MKESDAQRGGAAQDTTILQAANLHKTFGKTEILHGIDLNIHAGEMVSIMGPSGSGKSTLLYCLAGIIESSKGEISYQGNMLGKLSKKQKVALRRSDFGFIFQFGELVPELPVRDNVALPLLLRGTSKSDAYHAADQWLELVDLTKVARELPKTLSGGETQRAAIARAMAINPDIIFADEPTGSLDSRNSLRVMDLLVRLSKQYHKTVVFVTHSSELAARADRTVTIRDGKLVAEKAA